MLQMKGKQSVLFQEPVKIMSHACVGGKKEGEGPIGKHLDLIVDDPMFGKENWEESESSFLKTAGEIAIRKGKKKKVVVAKVLPFGLEGGENEDLFEALRGLRKQLADQEALPAYIVLSDKVLHLLSISRPTTIEEFGEISGIGEYKKKKYGKDFVNLIRQFVE